MKKKSFTVALTANDMLDVQIYYEETEQRLVKFALNYRAFINGKYCEIYRVDNFHGFLNEKKFWRKKEPIPIEELGLHTEGIINKYVDIIYLNYNKYRSYYEIQLEKGFKHERK